MNNHATPLAWSFWKWAALCLFESARSRAPRHQKWDQ